MLNRLCTRKSPSFCVLRFVSKFDDVTCRLYVCVVKTNTTMTTTGLGGGVYPNVHRPPNETYHDPPLIFEIDVDPSEACV